MSTATKVQLMDMNLDSGGRFKCEVLTEAPEFYLADRSSKLVIVGMLLYSIILKQIKIKSSCFIKNAL